ncbi:hypothetical protein ABPG74_014533 [Tetrahymena malaccensis]
MDTKQNSSSIYVESKKGAHSKPIISIDVNKSNPFQALTSSDDKTLRLWDLKSKISVKMFTSNEQKKAEQIANCIFGPEFQIYVAASKNVIQYDLRKEGIVVTSIEKASNFEMDDINQISLDQNNKFLACCDDQGDTHLLDPLTLERQKTLGMQHLNISFSTDFCYSDSNYTKPMCITSGFDCKLILWDIEEKKILRQNNIYEICQKYFPGQLLCPPNIYNVHANKTQILVSTETGHILCFTQKELKKPKYIIDGHLGKVMRSVFAKFNENRIISCSTDKTFAIWDTTNRNEFDIPQMVERISIPEKPNWIETSKNNQIFVPDITPILNIYTIKA